MTRRARLAKLERALGELVDLEPIVIYWADIDAGMWREGTGPNDTKADGRTLPIAPEEVEEMQAAGQYRIMLTGLPVRGKR